MPYTVNQLGYNDINYKFFNHVNWKGMCDDQNFASIDQETFSDCDNMYVDAEAVLRSRPSIKPDNELFSKPTTTALSIKDIRTFGNYQVVVWIGGVNNYVAFYKDKVYKAHSNITQSKYTIVQADNKIFVLQAPLSTGVTNNCMYDQTDDTLSTDQALIKSYFYKPITKVYVNGNAGTDVESPNELTTGYREEFLWKDDKQDTFTLNQFVAHYLQNNDYTGDSKVEIGNEAYDVHITEGIENVFVKQADIDNLSSISLSNVIVKNNIIAWTYLHLAPKRTSIVVSVDYGKTFNILPTVYNASSAVQISEDNTLVTIKASLKDDSYGDYVSIYAYSIAPDESGEKRFTAWTDLLDYNNIAYKNSDKKTEIKSAGYYVKSHNKLAWAVLKNSDNAGSVNLYLYNEQLKKYVLKAPAKPVASSTVIKPGTYSFNNELTASSDVAGFDTAIMFASNGKQYDHIKVKQDDIGIVPSDIMYGTTESGTTQYTTVCDNTGSTAEWSNGYQTITISTAQTVDEAFYNWFINNTNASAEISRYCFDLSYTPKIIFSGSYSKIISPAMMDRGLIVIGNDLVGNTDAQGNIIPANCNGIFCPIPDTKTISDVFYNENVLYSDGIEVYAILLSTYDNSMHSFIYYKNYSTTAVTIIPNVPAEERTFVGNISKILTSKHLYSTDATYTLLHNNVIPVSVEPLAYTYNNKIYSSALVDQVSIINTYDGDLQNYDYDYEAELSDYYFAKGKALFISAAGAKQDEDKDFMWYMPKINTQYFDYDITGLHPISTTEMAVFLKDSIYYCTYDSDVKAYRYYKSRVPLGKEAGSDVITTYDNKYTVFCTNRGLVAMAYQDFINSTEQALTFLSDTIFAKFSDWNQGAIKLYLYKFWLIVYRLDDNTAFVFDMRNNSWWPASYKYDLLKTIVTINDTPVLLLNGKTYLFNKSSEEYYDDNDGTKQIVWYFQSQKLHFNAINYYKHIVNMTVSSISDNQFTTKFVLKTTNYRKLPQIGKNTDQTNRDDTTISVQVEIIRVFSKRLNYYKVNEYQYKISSIADGADEKKITTYKPLCITSIAIKYLITGQVR